jgi:hypothetical protein
MKCKPSNYHIMQITISNEHLSPDDCQLITAITGTKEFIIERLEQLLKEAKQIKPVQGVLVYSDGSADVITPVWGGKRY